jgi:catechol 2,3-dioxygenase-like lactoylglutathione lyase family enzyme
MFKVQGVDHVGLAVKDVQKSVEWYRELFGLERLYEDIWGNSQALLASALLQSLFSPKMTSTFHCLKDCRSIILPSE